MFKGQSKISSGMKRQRVSGLRRRLSHVVDDFFRDWPDISDSDWLGPPLDVMEYPHYLKITMELKDFKRDDIRLELAPAWIVIRAENSAREGPSEQPFSSFNAKSVYRRVPLSFTPLQQQPMNVSFEQGILRICVVKARCVQSMASACLCNMEEAASSCLAKAGDSDSASR